MNGYCVRVCMTTSTEVCLYTCFHYSDLFPAKLKKRGLKVGAFLTVEMFLYSEQYGTCVSPP